MTQANTVADVKVYSVDEASGMLQTFLDALVAANKEIAALKAALEKINNLDYHVDGDGETNEWAEAVCYNKAQRIAHGALNLHKLRAD